MRWLLALLLFMTPALAQKVDPRIADPMIAALQSAVVLKDAQIKALMEDSEKRIAAIKEKCGDPCKDM